MPLVRKPLPVAHLLSSGAMPAGAGWELFENPDDPLFIVAGHAWISTSESEEAIGAPLLRALRPVASSAPINLRMRKKGYAIAVITLSDKGALGLRQDTAGPLAAKTLATALPVCATSAFILPDDKNALRGLLADLALTQKYDLICTCGGTGLGPRDITPQATASLLDMDLPGFGEAMRQASLRKTPNAIISRAICGAIGECLVLNLPGSAKAVGENLEAILPALNHALKKLQGDTSDCGAPA